MRVSELIDEEDIETLRRAKQRLDRAVELAEDQIHIDPPWNYDPSNYNIHPDGFKPALTWVVESRSKLEEANDDDLNKLAVRMEATEQAFIDEHDQDDGDSPYYKSLFLMISVQDGLISWLCGKDPSMSGDDPNNIGEEVYWGPKRSRQFRLGIVSTHP